MSKVRVLIADDQQLLCQSLTHLLGSQPGSRVVAKAATGVEVVSLIRELVLDIVLMDIRTPQLDRIAVTRSTVRNPHLSEVRVLAFTTFDLDKYVLGVLRVRTSDFLLKGATPGVLINTVCTVSARQTFLAPPAITTLVESYLPDATLPGKVADLTPRQTETLRLIARGLFNNQIERELYTSHAICETYILTLLSRLQVQDRTQLAITAYEHGPVHPGTQGNKPVQPARRSSLVSRTNCRRSMVLSKLVEPGRDDFPEAG